MRYKGEQLTLNQWVLGSSPRWCTKRKPPRRVPPWGLYFWLHARRTRTAVKATAACGGNREPEQGPRSQSRRSAQGAPADAGTATRKTAPQCRNQQSYRLLVSPRESPQGMGKRAERAGGRGVAATKDSLTENVGLFFIAIIRDKEKVAGSRPCSMRLQQSGILSWCTIGGREQLRRRPPPAAETGSQIRGSGRRGGVPSQGAPTDAGTATRKVTAVLRAGGQKRRPDAASVRPSVLVF